MMLASALRASFWATSASAVLVASARRASTTRSCLSATPARSDSALMPYVLLATALLGSDPLDRMT